MKKLAGIYVFMFSICMAGLVVLPTHAAPVMTPDAGGGGSTSSGSCDNAEGFLGFPAWFKGLKCDPVKGGGQTVNMGGEISNIWIIVLNVVQWLIVAAGYIAVYFIAWGGFKYIIAAGEPDKIKSAKDTLVNSIIGLVIVLASVAIVRTIQAGIIGSIK